MLTLAIPPSPTQREYLASSPVVSAPPNRSACPICYYNWNVGNETIPQTHCGHMFHRECLITWFGAKEVESANTCPSCRAVCFPSEPMQSSNAEITGERSQNSEYLSFLYQSILCCGVSSVDSVYHVRDRRGRLKYLYLLI
ncbi:uncharacterized protein K460DRAFT_62255 [Cucurbitaria berberidis CBS 394.84]|uniref:RING-type domain-containing protein n=1 Tax=Cucurbitaria berberidis CBS 394.84 TaxID=1168544 RepID=A0A9P4LAX6_9PLEO|nr:uncharacterized protein K460DRAFT_62255 [Cucurbitaria berberidis CBS 394.84]KAF1847639.1 hypothetical protein K460DRAFT_62255 [Cucurbitaria berberidis CBS 394.84]